MMKIEGLQAFGLICVSLALLAVLTLLGLAGSERSEIEDRVDMLMERVEVLEEHSHEH